MKTRTFSLPLVILAALILGSTLYAQPVARFQLIGYLEKMPKAPAFPDSSVLVSSAPTSFEDNSDLNATVKTLQELSRNVRTDEGKAVKALYTSMNVETPDVKLELESLQSAMKELQSVSTEYAGNFRRLENVFSKRIENAMAAMHKFESSHPCNGSYDCEAEHLRIRNSDVIAATKEKILNEQYILFVYLNRAKSSFKLVDNILRNANYGDRARSQEGKTIFRGAQQNQIQLLRDIIERLKLQRITISNCARMAQEGKTRK